MFLPAGIVFTLSPVCGAHTHASAATETLFAPGKHKRASAATAGGDILRIGRLPSVSVPAQRLMRTTNLPAATHALLIYMLTLNNTKCEISAREHGPQRPNTTVAASPLAILGRIFESAPSRELNLVYTLR